MTMFEERPKSMAVDNTYIPSNNNRGDVSFYNLYRDRQPIIRSRGVNPSEGKKRGNTINFF